MKDFIKKNYGWLIVTIISVGQLGIIFSLIDFSNGITFLPSKEWPNMSGPDFMVKITGEIAMRWLAAVLLATPVTILTGLNSTLCRQSIGISAAVFSFLHLIAFSMNEGFMATFSEFNFIAGFVATVILVPLLLTSNRKSMRILKKSWKKIQQFSYAAVVLAIVHLAALEDIWIVYAVVVGLGFVMRYGPVKEKIVAKRIKVIGK